MVREYILDAYGFPRVKINAYTLQDCLLVWMVCP
jgi:hypothetical protein